MDWFLVSFTACHFADSPSRPHWPEAWQDAGSTRSPSSALSNPVFGWEGSPTKIDYRKKRYPYSNLSSGGPSLDFPLFFFLNIICWATLVCASASRGAMLQSDICGVAVPSSWASSQSVTKDPQHFFWVVGTPDQQTQCVQKAGGVWPRSALGHIKIGQGCGITRGFSQLL